MKFIEYIVYISARLGVICTYVKLVYITDQFYPRNVANLYRSRLLTLFHISFLMVVELIDNILSVNFHLVTVCEVRNLFLAIGWLIIL